MKQINENNKKVYQFGRLKVSSVLGDITEQQTDVIVNSANPQLLPGAGVCGAIFNKFDVAAACRVKLQKQGRDKVDIGTVVRTGCYGYNGEQSKFIRHIFHVVGPSLQNINPDENPKKLQNRMCYQMKRCMSNILTQAFVVRDSESVSIPPISTGIYRFPVQDCAQFLIEAIFEFEQSNIKDGCLNPKWPKTRRIQSYKHIVFCNIDQQSKKVFDFTLWKYFEFFYNSQQVYGFQEQFDTSIFSTQKDQLDQYSLSRYHSQFIQKDQQQQKNQTVNQLNLQTQSIEKSESLQKPQESINISDDIPIIDDQQRCLENKEEQNDGQAQQKDVLQEKEINESSSSSSDDSAEELALS